MILGAEVAMLVMGLIGLVAGWIPAGKGRAVRGIPARFLGLICLLPIPVAMAAMFLTGYCFGMMGINIPVEQRGPLEILIELVVVLGFVGLVTWLSYRWSDPARFPAADLPGQAKPTQAGHAMDPDGDLMLIGPVESSAKARASLMLGVFSLLTSILGSIPAFIFGGLALAEIERSGGRVRGKGVAVAGIILGILGTFTGFIALAILLPFLKQVADPGPAAAPVAGAPMPLPNQPPPPAPVIAGTEPPKGAPSKSARPSRAPKTARPVKAKNVFDRSDKSIPTVAIESKPEATGAALANKARKVGDLKVTDLKVEAKSIPRCLLWGDEGRVVFILEAEDKLRRVRLDGFVEELKWEVGQKCSWLSLSQEGVVLTVEGLQEVWTLDPATFAIKTRTPAATVELATSSPATSLALATDNRGEHLAVLDLKAGKVLREYDSRSFAGQNVGYKSLVMAPDGKSAFAEGMERLIRFGIEGDELTFEEQSERIAQNGQCIEIGEDGSLVALPSGGGNYGKPPYTTNIYRAADLGNYRLRIGAGAYPQALGFDPKSGGFYAQNSEEPLILFGPGGIKGKSYKLAPARGRSSTTRQFLVHPEGGKLFALSDTILSFVEFPGKE